MVWLCLGIALLYWVATIIFALLIEKIGQKEVKVTDIRQEKPVDKRTLMLLAFFLGGIGAHKFYVGKNWQGIFYLLLSWTFVPGIVAILECLAYAFKKGEKLGKAYESKGPILLVIVMVIGGGLILGDMRSRDIRERRWGDQDAEELARKAQMAVKVHSHKNPDAQISLNDLRLYGFPWHISRRGIEVIAESGSRDTFWVKIWHIRGSKRFRIDGAGNIRVEQLPRKKMKRPISLSPISIIYVAIMCISGAILLILKKEGKNMEKQGLENHVSMLEHWGRKKLHDWFVLYNPLYFISALCVISGVFLVSRGLEETDWQKGQILLTNIIELYEILLITGAGLLFRKARKYRPAVILGMLAVFFLFDCTFQPEIIASIRGAGMILTSIWIVMAVSKLLVLAWVFRLKTSRAALLIPALGVAGIAIMPHVLAMTDDRIMTQLMAVWYGVALACAMMWMRPGVRCEAELDEWGETVLRRATLAAWLIWAAAYLYHLIIWFRLFDIPLMPSHVAPLFMVPVFLSGKERWVWAGCLGAIAMSLANPPVVSMNALFVGIAFLLHGWRSGVRRLYLGALLSLCLACWTIGWQAWPLPQAKLWLILAGMGILLIMGWRLNLHSAYLLAALGMIWAWRSISETGYSETGYLPEGPLGWGILLLICGFLALLAGVAISWRQRPADGNGMPM